MRPVRLTPSFREKVWGAKNLEPWFPASERKIGEVWFESDPPLPILVKFLFTSEKLSVQVHPPDRGGAPGKTEMWHILRADPGAGLAMGFRQPISPEEARAAAISGEIERLLDWFPVKPGETYFTPPGTVHAIGPGVVLCEIQQNNDLTYRIYDYGRPRELHLDQALEVATLAPHPGASVPRVLADGRQLLAYCLHFATESVRIGGELYCSGGPEPFHLWVCLGGSGRMGAEKIAPGDVWLVPDGTAPFTIRAEEPLDLLRTFVPQTVAEPAVASAG